MYTLKILFPDNNYATQSRALSRESRRLLVRLRNPVTLISLGVEYHRLIIIQNIPEQTKKILAFGWFYLVRYEK